MAQFEEQLKTLHATLSTKPPFCSGTIPLPPSGLVLYHGKGKDAPCLEFPNVSQADIEHLAQACDVTTFGVNEKNVHDESYRKSGKMDNSNYCTNFNIADSGLVQIIRDDLLEGDQVNAEIRTELYKLNVYAQPSLPIPYLKSLTIRCADIIHHENSWSPLFDLINSFSVIDYMVLNSIGSRGYRGLPPDGLTTILPGGKAKIGELLFLPELHEEVEEFVGAMAEHLDVTQIHTLETAQWHRRDLFEQVMATFGGVKHFHFLMREACVDYYISLPASQSSLESITFSIDLTEPDSDAESERASGTQLSTVRYEFLGGFVVTGGLNRFRYPKRVIENVDWPNLETILNKNSFKKLQVVEVLLTVPEVCPDDRPDEKSIHAKEAKKRAVLVDIVKDRLSNSRKECTVNVWVRDA